MQRLNQVVAVEKNLKQKVNKEGGDILKTLQKPALFEGHRKEYRSKDANGDALPPDVQHVQQNAAVLLTDMQKLLIELYDVCATRDWANCEAKADVVVDGISILEKVPATFLLFLEKQMDDLRTVVMAIPTLDPAETWTMDPNSGLCKSESRQSIKTAKVHDKIVLLEPTKEHPGQAQLIQVDKTIGTWDTVKMSGAMKATTKKALLDKVETFAKAVKRAREEANCMAAPDKEIGKAVFAHLWAGLDKI